MLYYYLKIRLAPGWKLTLHQREITKKLGIPKTSFYRAIENLSSEGLISWEAPNGLVVSLPQTELSPTDETQFHSWDSSSTNGTSSPTNGTSSPTNGTNTPHQPAQSQASSDPSNSYQIWLNSLSNTARESFLHFVREKIKDFKSPINDVEGWLAGKNQAGQYRFRVYYEMFQQEVGEAIAPSPDWENHPKWETALAAMRTGVPRFIVLGQPGCSDIDKPTRQEAELVMRQEWREWARQQQPLRQKVNIDLSTIGKNLRERSRTQEEEMEAKRKHEEVIQQ